MYKDTDAKKKDQNIELLRSKTITSRIVLVVVDKFWYRGEIMLIGKKMLPIIVLFDVVMFRGSSFRSAT